MHLKKIKDPKTEEAVEINEDGYFELSESTVSREDAKKMVENGETVTFDSEDNEIHTIDEEEEINLSEEVKSVLSDLGDLSESAQNKVQDIIETAVSDKVKKKEQELKEQFDKDLAEKEEEILEDVDSYLTYAAEEWKKENQVALENGARAEIAENLVDDIKKVFESHNIDLPEEKFDQVEELKKEVNALKEKVNDKHEENKSLKEQLESSEREDIIEEVGKDLAETEFDRFKELTEDLSFHSKDRFKEKAETVLETYFKKDNKKEQEVVEEEENNLNESDLAKKALRYI